MGRAREVLGLDFAGFRGAALTLESGYQSECNRTALGRRGIGRERVTPSFDRVFVSSLRVQGVAPLLEATPRLAGRGGKRGFGEMIGHLGRSTGVARSAGLLVDQRWSDGG